MEDLIERAEPLPKTSIPTASISPTAENLAKVLAKGAGLSMAGAVSYRALSYIYGIVIARGLGATLYGLFSLGLANIALARSVALLGLVPGGLRFIARYRTQQDMGSQRKLARTLFLLVFIWGSLIALALYLAAEPVARLNSQTGDQITNVLRWFSPAIPLSALLYVLSGIAEGQRRIGVGVLTRDTLQPLLALIFAGIIVLLNGTLFSLVGSFVVSVALSVWVTVYALRDFFLHRQKVESTATNYSLGEVLSFSFPLFPSKVLRDLTNRLEIFLLGFLVMPADVGIFTAAVGTSAFVAFGLQAVIKMYGTLAAELHAKGQLKELEALQYLATRWATAFSLPAVIVLALLGEEILTLFGSDFAENQGVLLILAIGQLVNAAAGPVASTLYMAGYSRLMLINSVAALAVKIGLELWLINQYGVIGAAIGYAAVIIVVNIVTVFEVQYLLGIRSFGKGLLPPLFAAGVAFVIVGSLLQFVRDWHHLIVIVVGVFLIGAIYVLSYWFVAPEADKQIGREGWQRIIRIANKG